MSRTKLIPHPPAKGSRIIHATFGLGTVTKVIMPKSNITQGMITRMVDAYDEFDAHSPAVSVLAMRHALRKVMDVQRFCEASIVVKFDHHDVKVLYWIFSHPKVRASGVTQVRPC